MTLVSTFSKHSYLKRAFFCLALVMGTGRGYAQASLDSLIKKFTVYRQEHLQEKVFVHVDRTTHLTGETLWFKVYCVNGVTHQPLDLSKVAYVEILSAENKSVVNAKIELEHGRGHGSFFLPATLQTGNYTLRAYTQWMKNSDVEYFFHQPVTIINPFRSNEHNAAKKESTYDAQFLPEGGTLIAGVTSKVGFRVTNSSGKGIDFKGSLVTGRGDTVLRFKPARSGIGTFDFKPALNETYKIVISDSSHQVNVFSCPEIYEEGYAMRVEKHDNQIEVQVQCNVSSRAYAPVYLFIHTRNQIVESAAHTLNAGHLTFAIPVSKLDDGISHITLFDHAMTPVCERLIFKAPEKKLILSAQTEKTQYDNRHRGKLVLTAENETNAMVNANVSVSIYKRDSLPSFHRSDIRTHVLLTSDLHGEVESPDSYFQLNSDEAFDQLMLTHGWRRFSWKNVFEQPHLPVYLPETQGLTVNGKLFNQAGAPALGIQSFLSFPSRHISFFSTRSKREGVLNFVLKNVHGPQKFIFQTNFSRDSLLEFQMENPFAQVFSTQRTRLLRIDPKLEAALINRSVSMQVLDVFRTDTLVPPSESADTIRFYGKPDETYYLDDFTRFSVMEEVMREYVPGVLVRKRKGKFHFLLHDVVNKSIFKEDPLMLIDGVPVFDTDKIMAFDPLRIRKLEVITKTFLYGQSIFPGIVSYSTYTGDLSGFQIHPKSIVGDFDGLQIEREFYQPRYDNAEARFSREPDQRTLLLWAPDITITDGKTEIEFFTSDQSGYFQVEVEGLTSSGRSGSTTYSFTVKPADNH